MTESLNPLHQRLQLAKIPFAKGRFSAFKRPNGLDPKVTSDITSRSHYEWKLWIFREAYARKGRASTLAISIRTGHKNKFWCDLLPSLLITTIK
eukprot:scaffold1170_cov174-Amphora_coffeaeformis.AAC.52